MSCLPGYSEDRPLISHSSRTRIRKVKCDETKPLCLRCTKTGRKCDGYLDPGTIAARRFKKEGATHDHILGPLLEFATPEEKRAFYFFQHVTAPCISGGFDAVFWRAIVLQISQTEPAVRHAVLAVSSLHEGLAAGISASTDGVLTRTTQSFALQQYNKAIARLLEQMHNPGTRPLASLLTCVLFVCIEYMQGKDKESHIHLEQGRQLLSRLDQRSTDPEMDCIVRHVVPLYMRLSLTSFLFGGTPVPIPESLKTNIETPDTFSTIDELRHSMHEFMEAAFRFTQRARPAKNPSDYIPQEDMRLLEVEQDRLQSRLAKLNVAFALFRASRSKPGPENALLVLQIYLHAQHIWISTALSSSEVAYDDFLYSFAAIVPLAASYLDLEASTKHRPTLRPQRYPSSAESLHYHPTPDQLSVAYASNFTFETHIIPPLYYVATKCRHPLIRRSALELLKKNPFRRENLWRASVMGALAGHIVSLEERWPQGLGGPAVAASKPKTAVLSLGRTSHNTLSRQMPPPRVQPHDTKSDLGLDSASMETEQKYAAVSSAAVSMTIPALGFGNPEAEGPMKRPVERSILVDVDISSSLSRPPSLTASLDDGNSTSSVVEPTMAVLDGPDHGDTWLWQQQQRQCYQRHDLSQAPCHPNPTTSAACNNTRDPSQPYLKQAEQRGAMADYSLRSGSSDVSSVDVEELQRYQMMVRGQTPQHQQAQIRSTPAPRRQQQPSINSRLPRNLPTEAPFGLPEELRIHDAVIGPEGEDGTWVSVFRKLHGFDADWDVQHQWVSTL